MIQPLHVVNKYIVENPAPARGFIYDKVQKPPIMIGVPGSVSIVYYAENFDTFPDSVREDLVAWLLKLQKFINDNYEKFFVVHLERKDRIPDEM